MNPAPRIDGVSNFRDAFALAGGARAAGRLFRSAHLAGLTEQGRAQLSALRVSRVVDLRGAVERRTAMPAVDAADIALVSTPIEPRTSGRLQDLIARGEATAPLTKTIMIASYRAYVSESATAFGDALVAVAGSAPGAALVHCTAGKDRTGFLIAVLQSVAGFTREQVLADYLETNAAWDRASVAGRLPLNEPSLAPVLVADADYLAAAFEEIERLDGSLDAFVRRATGGRLTADHLAGHFDQETSA